MKAKEYIIESLKKFISKVDDVKVRYKHDAVFNDHLIEILPKESTKHQSVIDFKADMYLTFLEKFKNDSLVFFSKGDYISIETPDFGCIGKNYKCDLWLNKIQPKKTRVLFNFSSTLAEVKQSPKIGLAA